MSTDSLAGVAPRPIDPLRSPECPGRYEDDVVVVERATPGRQAAGAGPAGEPGPARAPAVRTRHFDVARSGARLHVTHRVAPGDVDDDLAGLLTGELFGPGWVTGTDAFERIFTGVVLSTGPDALASWEAFYRNTLDRLAALTVPGPGGWQPAGGDRGSLAEYSPVYARALALVPAGSVLDVGSCFGFLALLLARRPGTTVTASDVSAGSVRLLAAVAPRLGVRLDTLVADATRLPLPDASVDVVTAVHLVEHLSAEDGAAAVAEAVRVARRRVVVAAPLEDEPTRAYGHVRCVTLDHLRDLGRHWRARAGRRWQVSEHHGGWLVLDA